MKDYLLYFNNNIYYEKNNNKKYDYIHLFSITKFVIFLGFIKCIKKYNISVNDKVKKIFPKYKYNYTFLDIINHKTFLRNDWYVSYPKKSKLQSDHDKSKNIYKFALTIEDKDINNGGLNFNYNNYTYNILLYTIYKLEKNYIENTILKDVIYKWDKINNKPIASHGLHIHTSTCKIFVQNILDVIQNNDISYFWDSNMFFYINQKKYYLIGHSGSFGQWLYYNTKTKSLLFWAAYGEYDEKIEKRRTPEKFLDIFRDVTINIKSKKMIII
jgi:hypothetical protein